VIRLGVPSVAFNTLSGSCICSFDDDGSGHGTVDTAGGGEHAGGGAIGGGGASAGGGAATGAGGGTDGGAGAIASIAATSERFFGLLAESDASAKIAATSRLCGLVAAESRFCTSTSHSYATSTHSQPSTIQGASSIR